MADKYSFLQSSVPKSEQNETREVSTYFRGLDMFGSHGYLSDGINFEITPDGSVRTASLPKLYYTGLSGNILSFYASGGYLYAVTQNAQSGKSLLTRIDTADGTISSIELADKDSGKKRVLALYSKWTGGSDIVSGKYEDVLLVFPDKKAVSASGTWASGTKLETIARYDITRTVTTETVITEKTYNNGWSQNEDGTYTLPAIADGTKKDIDTKKEDSFYGSQSISTVPQAITHPTGFSTVYTKEDIHGADGSVTGTVLYVTETAVTVKETFSAKEVTNAIPNADLITVHNTRLFGVDGSKIFASGAGSYSDYELDTADEFDENNAWYSATSGGGFTALMTYDGRVTAFKPQGLFQLYNTKNPFRVKEISKVGTPFGETVCETESLLYFTNETGVYVFNGSYPKSISLNRLDMSLFSGGTACGGGFNGSYYVWRDSGYAADFVKDGGHPVFRYDSRTGAWNVICFSDSKPVRFAATDKALYVLTEDGNIYECALDRRSGTAWYYEFPAENNLPASGSRGADTAHVKVLSQVQGIFKFRSSGNIVVSVLLDNGDYRRVAELERGVGTHAFYASVLPGDHVTRSIRIEGSGDVELISFEQIFKAGGTRYGQ